jgi:transcriptional regulator with XRE-family HTH domain
MASRTRCGRHLPVLSGARRGEPNPRGVTPVSGSGSQWVPSSSMSTPGQRHASDAGRPAMISSAAGNYPNATAYWPRHRWTWLYAGARLLPAACYMAKPRSTGSVIGLASARSKIIETPEVMRRRLRVSLRQAREALPLTQQAAADALDWSVSKIIRIEQGAVGITPIDLRALLNVYEVTDEKLIAELVELARGSRRQSWRQYKNVYSPASLTLFANEAVAAFIYKYEPTFIPGLLQTEDYARALLAGLGHDDEEIEPMVSARLERQELLNRERHPDLQFVMGEVTLTRVVGGSDVMLQQLEHLKELSGRPGVELQVLPFSAGAHPRMGGAFTILEFADQNLDDLLYLENAGGESTSRDDPDLIADYRRDFLVIQKLAIGKSDFADYIDGIIASRFSSG